MQLMIIACWDTGLKFQIHSPTTALTLTIYGKGSKFSNTFLFLFLKLVSRARSHKLHDRIANRGDPDQTASLEAV